MCISKLINLGIFSNMICDIIPENNFVTFYLYF